MTTSRSRVTPVIAALVADVVLVLIFVIIGRSMHGEDLGLVGVWITWWPFLVGLAVGWLAARAWQGPLGVAWPGILIWVVTVALGMVLRDSAGQGVDFSFVVAATIVLGIFLLGWRALAKLVARQRRRKA